MGHLPYNIFEKSIPRKNSDFIKEFARLSSSNQNKKFKSDEERQVICIVLQINNYLLREIFNIFFLIQNYIK